MGPVKAENEAQSGSSSSEPALSQGLDGATVQQVQSRLAVEEDGDVFTSHTSPDAYSHFHEPDTNQCYGWAFKGKGRECAPVTETKKPLNLLDLPIDLLREIVNQLPHTNDLTSLALCHSVLHNLAVPCIYSRFDIVWPDANTQSESRTGVDALTYGLATLVMHEEVFGEAPWQRRERKSKASATSELRPYRIRRRGNYYAQYTKKFSLGNGPQEYVNEYLITKEGGKMLGTLVALAVARMRNLEAFVWDMPTGVLRDVWLALSSLEDRDDGENCRLERVWIRWHDNGQYDLPATVTPPSAPQLNIGPPAPMHSLMPNPSPLTMAQASHYHALSQGLDRVEHPTFSVLPPLKSLSVLDIDELPYLDELSILIARSLPKLRVLRIGIAPQVEGKEWAEVWEGDSLYQVDYTSSSTLTSNIADCRLGGVLGVLVGRFYNMRNNAGTQIPAGFRNVTGSNTSEGSSAASDQLNYATFQDSQPVPVSVIGNTENQPDGFPVQTSAADSPTPIDASTEDSVAPFLSLPSNNSPVKSIPLRSVRHSSREARFRGPYLDGKLRLDDLQLERVSLDVSVLFGAIDWTILSSITLLNCPGHEALWKLLRQKFAPEKQRKSSRASMSPSSTPRRRSLAIRPTDYCLNLKSIHTNTASLALVHFVRDALAPNSLEVLFLQGSKLLSSTAVPMDTIYRGIVRRHRTSLKKLLIDSSEPRSAMNPDPFSTSDRWKNWLMKDEFLTFITSGKMTNLRELGFVIDYTNWHFFLQRLPNIPQVRSLYIPHVADHPHSQVDQEPQDLALQIVDIVALRRDIELCYVGINNKCFEILESKAPASTQVVPAAPPPNPPADIPFSESLVSAANDHVWFVPPSTTVNLPAIGGGLGNDALVIDGEDDDLDNEADMDPMNSEQDLNDATPSESDEDVASHSFDSDEDYEDELDEYGNVRAIGAGGEPHLRLREILFYDDKVAVFKARHGKL